MTRKMTVLVPLHTLAPGARFRIPDAEPRYERTGTLLYVNECRARVRFDGSTRHVTITGEDGMEAEFDAPSRPLDIAPTTEVVKEGV